MADAWRIIDARERPDLVEGARQGKLNWATCPACKTRTRLDVNTVFFHPDWSFPVVVSLEKTPK